MKEKNPNLRVVNCCKHPVSIYRNTVFDPAVGKSKGGEPIISFQPSGIVASARSSVEAIPDMEYNGVNIPVCKRNFAAVSELPEDNTCLYIVSSLYATASKELGYDTANLLVPHGEVIDENGRKVGCTQLVRVSA